MQFLVFSEFGIVLTDDYNREEIEDGTLYQNIRKSLLDQMKEVNKKYIPVVVSDVCGLHRVSIGIWA